MQVEGIYTAEPRFEAKARALKLKQEMAAAAEEEQKRLRGMPGLDLVETPKPLERQIRAEVEAKVKERAPEAVRQTQTSKVFAKPEVYDRTVTPSGISDLGEAASVARLRGGFGGQHAQEPQTVQDTDTTLGWKLLRILNAGSGKFFSGFGQAGSKIVGGLEEVEQYLNGGWTSDGQYVKGDSPIVSSLLGWVHGAADDVTAQANAELDRSARNWSDTKAGQVFNEVAVNGVAAIPQAMLAFGTGGASAAGQLGAQAGTLETALRSLVSNPRFWLAYGQNAGESYAKAKAAGASDSDALVAGTFTGLTNAMIDLGGGYENSSWMSDQSLGGGQIVKNLGKSVLEQSGEEYAKDAAGRMAEKHYTPDKQWYSTKDENAVFNPKRDARQLAADAATAVLVEGSGYATRRFFDGVSDSLQRRGVSGKEAESRAREAMEVAEESIAHENAANALIHDDYDDRVFSEVIEKAKQPGIMEIEMDEATEKVISERSFAELQPLQGKMSNRAARRWYIAQDEKIPSLIDTDLSIEEQAMLACELRNQNRTWARDLMFDQEARKMLDLTDPNKSFEELVERKMIKYGMSRDEAIKDIYRTATVTRTSVNRKYGLK